MSAPILSHDPATVCAALSPLLLDERRARIDAAVAARLGGLRVVIENLHDPHNGAAVLRSAEGFGIQRVEVIEFFYYGCPVCYEAQPHIAKWLMRAGPGIAMLRVPAPFAESSESFARRACVQSWLFSISS